jgi:hypothetical protein
MIIYPALLLSSPVGGVSMRYPRIGYQTYLRDLDISDVTVSTETAAGPRDSPLREDTAEYWEPSAIPATWEVDLGALNDVDYIGIAGHTIGSTGCSILIETSDGSTAGSPAEQVWTTFASDIAPGDDAPLMFLDDTTSCRYIRLTLDNGTAPKISSIYAGEVLAMEHGVAGGFTPSTYSRETVLHQSLSRGGQFLGQSYQRHGVTGRPSFIGLDPDWYRENFDPFVKQARKYPYFFAWNPEDFPLEIAYAWSDKDIVPAYMGVEQYMQVSWSFRGIGNE